MNVFRGSLFCTGILHLLTFCQIGNEGVCYTYLRQKAARITGSIFPNCKAPIINCQVINTRTQLVSVIEQTITCVMGFFSHLSSVLITPSKVCSFQKAAACVCLQSFYSLRSLCTSVFPQVNEMQHSMCSFISQEIKTWAFAWEINEHLPFCPQCPWDDPVSLPWASELENKEQFAGWTRDVLLDFQIIQYFVQWLLLT